MRRPYAQLGAVLLLSTRFNCCHSFSTTECEKPPTHATLRRSENVSSDAEIVYQNCSVVTISAKVNNENTTTLDATNLEIQAISSFPNVTEVQLSGNQIMTIYEDAESSVKTLDLSRNALKSLTNLIIPSSVNKLILDGNSLTSLDKGEIPDATTSLSLANNGIKSLSSFSFSETLQELNTSGNALADLSKWQMPSQLATFSCRDCHIQKLSGLALPASGSLTILDLEGNTVDTFETGQSCLPLLSALDSLELTVSRPTCTDSSAQVKKIHSVPICVLPDAVYNRKFVISRTTSDSIAPPDVPSVTTQVSDSPTSSRWMLVAMISGAVLLFLLIGSTVGYLVFHHRRSNAKYRDDSVDRMHSVFQSMGSNNFTSYSVFERTLNTEQIESDEDKDETVLNSKFRRITSTTNSSIRSPLTSFERHFDNDIRIDPEMQQFRLLHDEVEQGELLAKGGYGAVYLATFRRQTVVMKQLLPDHARNFEMVNDFMDEIRIGASLDHPKIVTFLGFTYTSLLDLSAVFEYMLHGDLATLLENQLKRETLDPTCRDLFTWFYSTPGECKAKSLVALDIVEALVYLHSFDHPMIHRDLKPKNVLLSETWDAKLTDFGTSREVREDQTMTAEIGTVSWIAPEVLRGERYSEKADVYSFGVIMSELDTCRRPYSDNVTADKNRRGKNSHTNARIAVLVSAGTLRPSLSADCPESVATLINKCLDNNPLNRPSAVQLHYEIRNLDTSQVRKPSESAIILIEDDEIALLSNEKRDHVLHGE